MPWVWRHVFAVTVAIGIMLIAAAAIGSPFVTATPGVIVVDDDHGGAVDTYIMWYTRIAHSGVPVHFKGACISACTLGLALPKEQMCVEPTASFGFHLATNGDKPDPEITAVLIRRYYPPGVRKWLAGKQLTEDVIFMSAAEAVKYGVMDYCEALPTS